MASDAVPACHQNEPSLTSSPDAWRPQLLPRPPTALRLSERGGWTCSEFLPGARETVHTVPASRPGANRPLPLTEAAVGTCPFVHHGLPPQAPQRN